MSDAVFMLSALGIICGSIVAASTLRLMRTYLESRGRSPQSPLPHDVDDRLRQIQATVETTAIEVERVAEANRYLTRVLAERGITPVLDAPSNRAPAKQ